MHAFPESPVLVRLASGSLLMDGESGSRAYVPPDGVRLEPGLYVVHWPADVADRRFDENAIYLGPFGDLEQARAALRDFASDLPAPRGAVPSGRREEHEFIVEWAMC